MSGPTCYLDRIIPFEWDIVFENLHTYNFYNFITTKMKIIFFVALTIGIVVANQSFAQNNNLDKSGIYFSSGDFIKQNLSYRPDNNMRDYRIKLHELFESPSIAIIYDGKKQKLMKNEVYGYRDKLGRDYRFTNNKVYQILDTTNFYLYKKDKYQQIGKGQKIVPEYFFSLKAGEKIQDLTLYNLKTTFSKNAAFQDLIDAQFNYDNELMKYDDVYETYRIKHIYSRSLIK
ncbi:hypothetical protein [Pedobacter nutrimenti]|uniref:Uncharacterized protein n=1 Tax=Pedobacter nutrimenti TaxID=1241337 RepID=A0A318UE57_9SPHI|nr:hypothetical protein [Pedobacter nutrimenti]PYF74652.1 hypothetical protein B0O44_10397 [Pedobacter nutrimenti]